MIIRMLSRWQKLLVIFVDLWWSKDEINPECLAFPSWIKKFHYRFYDETVNLNGIFIYDSMENPIKVILINFLTGVVKMRNFFNGNWN